MEDTIWTGMKALGGEAQSNKCSSWHWWAWVVAGGAKASDTTYMGGTTAPAITFSCHPVFPGASEA